MNQYSTGPNRNIANNRGEQCFEIIISRTTLMSCVYVIVRRLSTVGYTSVSSVIHSRDSGLTILIHDRCSCSLFTSVSSVALVDWMCPLKREQATRVSYNTLTHSRLYCGDREKK